MIAVELAESDVEAVSFQFCGDATATAVDGKDAVVRSMRDEEAGLSVLLTRNHEPW